MALLINSRFDLFQIGFFFKSNSIEPNIFLHAPMVEAIKQQKISIHQILSCPEPRSKLNNDASCGSRPAFYWSRKAI
jgi:hypothetical protein